MGFCRRKLSCTTRKAACLFVPITILSLVSQRFIYNQIFAVSRSSSSKVGTEKEHSHLKSVKTAEQTEDSSKKILMHNIGKDAPEVARPMLNKQQKMSMIANRVPPGYFIVPVSNKTNLEGSQVIDHVIAPITYQKDDEALKRYISYLQKVENPLPLQTKAVVLLTNYRSGSSFFGELLNQHPDVFYMFEPLILVSRLYQCDANVEVKKQILKDISQCNIPDWMDIYTGLPRQTRPRLTRNIFVCNRRKFCFVPFTKELCSEEHCPRVNASLSQQKKEHDCWTDCGAINVNLVNNLCRRKKLVAVKVIRFCDLYDLEEIITRHRIDLKVVHLVRDPRSTATSRHFLNRRLDLKRSMSITCTRQANNADVGLLTKPSWLEGRYKMFRYEDAALRPYETTRELYDYLDLPFPESVKDWIAQNTLQQAPSDFKTSSDMDEMLSAENGTTVKTLKLSRSSNDPWGHSRDSKSVVQKWRRKMPFLQAKMIEQQCGVIMRQAGYLPADNPLEYKNVSVPLFTARLP